MAIQFNDNLAISLSKPIDARYFAATNVPFGTVANANAGIPLSKRHLGLTVLIGSGTNGVEYWYMGGTADANLVQKTSGLVSANNGLSLSSTTVKLGGPLLANTDINLSDYTLTLKSAGTYTTGIQILPGAANPNPTINPLNLDRVAITGNLSVSAQSYFAGNIGMGATPFLPSNTSGDVRVNIFKIGLPGTGKGAIGSSSSAVELTDQGTYTGLTTSYFGNVSRIYFSFTGTLGPNQILNSGSIYTGGLSYFQFATAKNVSGGTCSAHAAQAQFSKTIDGDSGNIDKVIGYRAMGPVGDTLLGYEGTVGEMIGLQIERQKIAIGTGTVTDAYGIKQLGGDDKNEFQGPTKFFNPFVQFNIPSYPDSGTAEAALPVGCLYRIGILPQVYVTMNTP